MTTKDTTPNRRSETRGGYLSEGSHPSPTTLGEAHERIRELERLCAEVYVAAVELGLPDPLLQRLWRVAAGGTLPQAFVVDLPNRPPRARPEPPKGADASPAEPAGDTAPVRRSDDGVRTSRPRPGFWQRMWRSARGQVDGPPPVAAESRRSLTELRPLSQRFTVLVADDDPAMLQLLIKILQRENFDLIAANDGLEALAKAQEAGSALKLLVTDYEMPGLTGRELADRVLAINPAVKILFQTGFSDALFSGQPDLGDSAAFLEKPFTARGLREAARFALLGTLNR